MKKLTIVLMMILGVVVLANAQMSDYTLKELKIDMKQEIDICELYLVIDDIYYPVSEEKNQGSTITLMLADYQDYLLLMTINDTVYFYNISTLGKDIIDERDLNISADVDYQFEKGTLVFNH